MRKLLTVIGVGVGVTEIGVVNTSVRDVGVVNTIGYKK